MTNLGMAPARGDGGCGSWWVGKVVAGSWLMVGGWWARGCAWSHGLEPGESGEVWGCVPEKFGSWPSLGFLAFIGGPSLGFLVFRVNPFGVYGQKSQSGPENPPWLPKGLGVGPMSIPTPLVVVHVWESVGVHCSHGPHPFQPTQHTPHSVPCCEEGMGTLLGPSSARLS
jgi:hypothetical protein